MLKRYFSALFLIVLFVGYTAYRRFLDFQAPSLQAPSLPSATKSLLPLRRSGEGDDDSVPRRTQTAPQVVPQTSGGTYRNGRYTGISANSYYGNVQVVVSVAGGKISDVQFLAYPNDRGNSLRISAYAMVALKSETIQNQGGPVDIVSGATETTGAFNESLLSALAQAKR